MSITTIKQSHAILPAEVNRDEDGYWIHPDFPHFEDEISNSEWQEYLEQNQLQSEYVDLFGDAPEDISDRYCESGDADCSDWEPTKPAGDGWFLFGIWDTEDGPTSCWVRHTERAAD